MSDATRQASGLYWSVQDGARRVIPLAIAVAGFGVSFGVLAVTAGMTPIAALVMSVTTFAGSAQFAAASILSEGGGVAAAVGAAVLLNGRYLPIGISVAPAFDGSILRRAVQAQLVVDESWAVGHVGDGRYDRRLLLGAGGVTMLAWVGGTALGALGGDVIGPPERLGLDAAFPALFLALLVGQVRDRRALSAAVLGVVVALALVPVLPPGVPVIVAGAACLIGWRP